MHGLIFTAFRRFTAAELPEADARIWRDLPLYAPDEAYADEAFGALVDRTIAETGRTRREILVGFGSFTSRCVFCELRPDFYDESGSARQFLLDVELRIHQTVSETIRGAAPPRLRVVPFGASGVSITYVSERRLCELLEGLAAGTAAYYGEEFEIDHPICMERGDEACAFFLTPRESLSAAP